MYFSFLFVRVFAKMCNLMFIRISPFRSSPVGWTVESNPESLNSSVVVFRDDSGFDLSILNTYEVICDSFSSVCFLFRESVYKANF